MKIKNGNEIQEIEVLLRSKQNSSFEDFLKAHLTNIE